MKVDSKVTINQSLLKDLTAAAILALEQTAEAVHTEVVQAQVVPRDTGRLQNEAMHVDTTQSRDGSVSIVHSTPYARRLYFHPEYNFNQLENPNAKGEWFNDWLPGGNKADFAAKAFQELYRRAAGI